MAGSRVLWKSLSWHFFETGASREVFRLRSLRVTSRTDDHSIRRTNRPPMQAAGIRLTAEFQRRGSPQLPKVCQVSIGQNGASQRTQDGLGHGSCRS